MNREEIKQLYQKWLTEPKPNMVSISMDFENKLISDPEYSAQWFREEERSGEEYFYEELFKVEYIP